MSRNLVRPFFPVPPADYQPWYFAEVVRSFSVYLNQIQNPGEGRNTFTVFTDLQQNDVGLEVGSVYRHNNDLKIVLLNISAPAGVSASASVGSVTVATT